MPHTSRFTHLSLSSCIKYTVIIDVYIIICKSRFTNLVHHFQLWYITLTGRALLVIFNYTSTLFSYSTYVTYFTFTDPSRLLVAYSRRSWVLIGMCQWLVKREFHIHTRGCAYILWYTSTRVQVIISTYDTASDDIDDRCAVLWLRPRRFKLEVNFALE